MFLTPSIPNPADFLTFVYMQGVPQLDLPAGSLAGASIDTSGNLTAISSSGTVSVGMVLYGTGSDPSPSLLTWNGTTLTGTILPVPALAISGLSLSVYMPWLLWAFDYATYRCIEGDGYIPPEAYTLAVYNLAMHQLLKIGLDQSSQTWFANARTQFKLLSFTGGVISAAADQNTSQAVAIPDLLKNLSLSNLDCLKTPWGREYLGYAMNFGPYIVGMS